MAEFAQAYKEMKIPLFVLPLAKPKYNGGVERSNRIFRDEFYNQSGLIADSIGALPTELKKSLAQI